MITLDVISDPICPWCYIGKQRLTRALEANPDHPLVLRWHPYQLNPNMPKTGLAFHEYLETKFGTQETVLDILKNLTQIGESEGIPFDLASIKRVPNTIDAHRLIHWAGMEGKQNAVVDRLFSAHFRDGKNIGLHEVLLEIARASGMDMGATEKLLKSDADIETIQEADEGFRNSGVTGVPCFIVSNHYVVQGAQTADFWSGVIKELIEKVPVT